MSRIFEALQRSDAGRFGAEFLALQAATGRQPPQPEREVHKADAFWSAPVLRPAPPVDARLVCLTDHSSLGAEKFRVLGLRLRHLRGKRELTRIVITSTIPEEGKSLVAANLALNQARE